MHNNEVVEPCTAMALGIEVALEQRISLVSDMQARRYAKLRSAKKNIATQGIIRHFRACARAKLNPDIDAIREIIDDALNNRSVFNEINDDDIQLVALK